MFSYVSDVDILDLLKPGTIYHLNGNIRSLTYLDREVPAR